MPDWYVIKKIIRNDKVVGYIIRDHPLHGEDIPITSDNMIKQIVDGEHRFYTTHPPKSRIYVHLTTHPDETPLNNLAKLPKVILS